MIFGAIAGRRKNRLNDETQNVGCGTGLSLNVTGIDISVICWHRARRNKFIAALHVMDAGNMQFPDNQFDSVLATFVIDINSRHPAGATNEEDNRVLALAEIFHSDCRSQISEPATSN